MIPAFFTDLFRALHELFSPRLLTPDDCRMNIPAWKTKQVEPRTIPEVGSNAKRVPGDARVFVWGDLSTIHDAGTLTPLEWGYVVEAYPSATPQLAGIIKRGISEGLTHAEIAHEAGQRLDKRVSVSVVSKIGAALSKSVGEGVANSGVVVDEN